MTIHLVPLGDGDGDNPGMYLCGNRKWIALLTFISTFSDEVTIPREWFSYYEGTIPKEETEVIASFLRYALNHVYDYNTFIVTNFVIKRETFTSVWAFWDFLHELAKFLESSGGVRIW